MNQLAQYDNEVVEVPSYNEPNIWPKFALILAYGFGFALIFILVPLVEYFIGYCQSFSILYNMEYVQMGCLGMIIMGLVVGYVVILVNVRKWYRHFYPAPVKVERPLFGVRRVPKTVPAPSQKQARPFGQTRRLAQEVPGLKSLILFFEDPDVKGRLMIMLRRTDNGLKFLTNERPFTFDPRLKMVADGDLQRVALDLPSFLVIKLEMTDKELFKTLIGKVGEGVESTYVPAASFVTGPESIDNLVFLDWLVLANQFVGTPVANAYVALLEYVHTQGRS